MCHAISVLGLQEVALGAFRMQLILDVKDVTWTIPIEGTKEQKTALTVNLPSDRSAIFEQSFGQ